MTDSLSDDHLSQLSDFVAATLGLHFPPGQWGLLERQTGAAAKEFGFLDPIVFRHWLLSADLTQTQIETLAGYLTISESYFWREPRTFEALRGTILPDLIRARVAGGRTLRIWSAGCASGQEPYSIAILLRELIPNLNDWRITLLATDVNAQNLRQAALGVYGEWSFRNVPPSFKERYFHRQADGRYEILPEIRAMVTLARLNLADDVFPSPLTNTHDLDIIFCRNVLMYFVPELARQVKQRFYRALVDDGWLIVAAAELSQQLFPQFTPVCLAGTFIYRREPESEPATAIAPVKPSVVQTITVQPSWAAALPTPQPRALPTTRRVPAVKMARAGALPDLPSAVRRLADQGKLGEALDLCVRAIGASKLDPSLHYLHAVILQEQKRDDEAKTALKRALYLDPSFVLAHFALGSLARRRGETLAAQKSFQNALALLEAIAPDDVVPEAEGLTASRLLEVVHMALETGDLTR